MFSQPIRADEASYKKTAVDLLNGRFESPKLASNIPFFDREGSSHLLKEAKGKLVIVYFWASWCSVCVEEIKSLSKLAEELSFKDLNEIAIIAVSIDFKNQQRIGEFMAKHKITNLVIYFDPHKELMGSFEVKSIPTTFIVNKQGVVINGFERNINWKDKAVLPALLAMKDVEIQDQVSPYINSDSGEKSIIMNEKKSKTTILN
ncbi:MAG: TlpA family protein disulfide reductase [Rickettsiales bacterium]